MPHRWVSPLRGMSLAGVEQQITERLRQKKDSKDLSALREQLRHELAVERHRLPHKRAEAESEATALNARVIQEVAVREALGLPPPQGHFKEEHLHELMNHAAVARDTPLLERIYKIEREQTIGAARATSDPESIRRLEEKYAGLKLTAEVCLHQDERALLWAQQHSIAILLPARDKQGKDIAVSLGQYEARKGLRGALGKLGEGQERREMRSRLETVKETYLGHRGSEVEAQVVYHRALQAIVKDCHELSRGYGYHTLAAPALPAERIAEIRAYALKQPEGIAKPWLKGCVQAQALLESWTAQPYRVRESAEKITSQSEGRESAEKVEKQVQEMRQRQERGCSPSRHGSSDRKSHRYRSHVKGMIAVKRPGAEEGAGNDRILFEIEKFISTGNQQNKLYALEFYTHLSTQTHPIRMNT